MAPPETDRRIPGPGGSYDVPQPDVKEPETGAAAATDGSVVGRRPDAAEINEAWTCPICLSWFDMPVAPPCQHSFCAGCLKSVVRAAAHRQPRNGAEPGPARPACPLCREPFSPETVAPNARVFEDMLRATVSCRNGDCTAQFCPLRWKHHQEECPAAAVQCTHQMVGCAWKGLRRDLAAHTETCAYEKIKGLIPRVSASLKQIHTQVHALEARVMAQNAAVANTRAFVMGMHQRERRAAVFPAAYALLWRPLDWRRYTCPNPAGVLANATLICLAPIAFLALWGTGMLSGDSGLSVEQRVVCCVGLAMLAFLAFLEYDNSTPWHELQSPSCLKGLRISPALLESTSRFVVWCAIKGLPQWKRLPAVLLLVAPLTYPTVVQGFHRFQVKLKNAQNEAQRALTQPPLPPPREAIRASPIKAHGSTVNGVVRASAMLMFGLKAALVAQVVGILGVCLAAAALGPETLNKLFEHVWEAMSAGISMEEKEHLKQLQQRNFRAMEAPFPNLTEARARACMAAACLFLLVVVVAAFRDSVDAIGFSLISMSIMNSAHLRWEVHVGRWVMASLEQTSSRLNPDAEHTRNPSLDLLRSRALLLWVVVGSLFFALIVLTS